MLREDLIRIVKIFQNDGVDEITNKKITNDQLCDFFEFFDDNVNHEAGIELVFDLEKYGLPQDATAEEIVDFALKENKNVDMNDSAEEIVDFPRKENKNMEMNHSIEDIRNNNDLFTMEQKNRIQICMLQIGEVFIKSFANDDILLEYENYMQTKQLNMPKIEKFINEFDETYFSYVLSYLAENLFKEILVIYALSGLKNIISDVECKCINLNYNFLIEQSKLLEEKMFQCNHNNDSVFSGFQNYKYNEKIAGIIELAIEDKNTDKKLQELYEELLQFNL